MNNNNAEYHAYINEVSNDLKSTLQAGLEYIRWDKYIDKNTRVFVKPNFTAPTPQEGVTTNPRLLESLLEILATKAGTVTVGESDGGNNSFKAEDAFKGHDMYQICRKTGAELVSLSTLPSRTVTSKISGKRVEVELPRMLLEDIDCFISVPVLKVHVMTTVTISLKNSWGCLPDTMRGLHHENISRKLALIAQQLKPRIVVIDGTYALNKHGPMYGEPVAMNLVVVADNTVAADALGASLMGFSPRKINHIAVAEKAGLGPTELSEIDINKDWKPFRRQFEIQRTILDRFSTLPFNSKFFSRLIFRSPFTPLIYKVVAALRTPKEKEIASQMGKQKQIGPY